MEKDCRRDRMVSVEHMFLAKWLNYEKLHEYPRIYAIEEVSGHWLLWNANLFGSDDES